MGEKAIDASEKAGELNRRAPFRCHSGRVNKCRWGSAPRRVPAPPLQPVPRGFSPRGCKGRSPLHKITLSLPLPRRGREAGGWGKKLLMRQKKPAN